MYSRQSSGSSDPSPQSSTVSHFHQNGIHLSVLHRNLKKEKKIGKRVEEPYPNIKWIFKNSPGQSSLAYSLAADVNYSGLRAFHSGEYMHNKQQNYLPGKHIVLENLLEFWSTDKPIHLHMIYGCSCTTTTELCSCY